MFPLGMYVAATRQLVIAARLSFLDAIPRVFIGTAGGVGRRSPGPWLYRFQRFDKRLDPQRLDEKPRGGSAGVLLLSGDQVSIAHRV
jgi:hypothetical protein